MEISLRLYAGLNRYLPGADDTMTIPQWCYVKLYPKLCS